MLDRFAFWQYRDDNNCWDYVREFLIEKAGIPADHVPKFGIAPKDKRSMHKAGRQVAASFKSSDPTDFAVACHYRGGVLFHVGIVHNGRVRHTGEKIGTRNDTIEDFESMADTVYMLHKSLWQ